MSKRVVCALDVSFVVEEEEEKEEETPSWLYKGLGKN